MAPVDLDRLRALYDAAQMTPMSRGDMDSVPFAALAALQSAMEESFPALLDELAILRAAANAAQAQCDTCYVHGKHDERTAIVAWLRDCAEYDMADRIERGDHLAEEPQP